MSSATNTDTFGDDTETTSGGPAVGETMFTTRGKKLTKFAQPLLPKGDYELVLQGQYAEVRSASKPGSAPYVNVPFAAVGSGKNGKLDVRVYHRFFLKMTPVNASDKTLMTDRADQLLGLSLAVGMELNFPIQYMEVNVGKGNTVILEKTPIVKPQAVLQWLKENDGLTLKAHVKIRKDTGFEDRNEISYFISQKTESPLFD